MLASMICASLGGSKGLLSVTLGTPEWANLPSVKLEFTFIMRPEVWALLDQVDRMHYPSLGIEEINSIQTAVLRQIPCLPHNNNRLQQGIQYLLQIWGRLR